MDSIGDFYSLGRGSRPLEEAIRTFKQGTDMGRKIIDIEASGLQQDSHPIEIAVYDIDDEVRDKPRRSGRGRIARTAQAVIVMFCIVLEHLLDKVRQRTVLLLRQLTQPIFQVGFNLHV